MSNKWAESYGGHWDHSESQYYSSIGLSDSHSDDFEYMDYGLEDMDYGLEDTDIRDDAEDNDIKGVVFIVAIILIALLA